MSYKKELTIDGSVSFKENYKKSDDPAKQAVIKHLRHEDVRVAVPPDKYDVDLIGWDLNKDMLVFHEVEMKHGWVDQWPRRFTTVDIPIRKQRLVKFFWDWDMWFWICSGDLKQAWRIPVQNVQDKFIGFKNTSWKKRDKFFFVPLEFCEKVKLQRSK